MEGKAEEKKSYQFRALSRKTLSYQKRQIFTNICCVGCCPFLMVAVCGILTIAIGVLITSLNEVLYFRYCANDLAMDPISRLSEFIEEPFVDSKGETKIRNLVNFNPRGPCEQWFGESYRFSDPYSPAPIDNCSFIYNPELCPLESTSPVKPPLLGWFPDPLTFPQEALLAFYQLLATQNNFWALFGTEEGVDVGMREKGGEIKLNFPFGSHTPPQRSGLLGNITSQYFTHGIPDDFLNQNLTFEERPYFEKVNSGGGSFEEVNDRILEILDEIVETLSGTAPADSASDEEKLQYTLFVQEQLNKVPFGAVLFSQYDSEGMEFTLQVGTSRRIAFISTDDAFNGGQANLTFPGFLPQGLRRIILHSKITQAFLNSMPDFSGYSLTQGLRIFPSEGDTSFSVPVGSFTGEILYPFGVSFLLPVFVVNLVKEKEERILIMMRMNGMKSWVYWLSEFVHFYILHFFSTVIFIVTGVAFRLEFFTQTDPGAYVLLFFIWGLTQISMAFFLSTLFNKSRVALMLVFCLVLAGVVINVSLSFFLGSGAPVGYLIYPPFAFYRALSIMNQKAFTPADPNYSMSMMVPGDPVFKCVIAMILETIILFLFSFYMMAVLPSEYGTNRPWHFVVTDLIKWYRKKQNKVKAAKEKRDSATKITINDDGKEDDHFGEDEDVKAERLRIYNDEFSPDSPVIIKDMKKIYPNGKLAVKSVSLAIDNNSVFGLLGPNGAGKTTLISILTGLYPPSHGNAFLAGFDVNTEMKDIYLNIGVCPQHDILWDDLTVEEHLLFYARIKGIPPEREGEAVKKAMETVSLTKFKGRLSKGLSGGEKRRLSIAISLIGEGKVVFLDEPTTGLDPEVRRLIWDIINDAKVGRTIILTTHSMEEAEVLCQRIGIMAKGTLRCIGPQVRLKNKYGSGFKIFISCSAEDHERATRYVESQLPSGWRKMDDFVGNTSYEFEAREISGLFKEIGDHHRDYGIRFWGISQTSLEEVFLRIINEADAEAS